ncbi:MAG: 1-deoxy-D-xylulose-5-phosphate synthase [Clostridia bacterium]|nr:1-deoxy-D-xylulose-5-phosphate synthase [Clostridia bacterium]
MKKYPILEKINTPDDVKCLSRDDLPALAAEARSFLIDNVLKTGGHLASNLGTVELTVALHYVFSCPADHFIFDVGHQAYTHKLLTGRRKMFSTLRSRGGLSGFTKRSESVYDCFGAGHSSTSVSAASGIAEADRLSGNQAHTVVVLGDGSFTGGMVHEALNNLDVSLPVIIVLNENEMSISKNIGRFAKNIAKIRSSRKYYRVKRGTAYFISSIPLVGRHLFNFIKKIKQKFKDRMYGSNYFEDMGLYYLGPCDGNDTESLVNLFEEAKQYGRACLVHVKTKKGCGLPEAENNPEKFHSIRPEGSPEFENFGSRAGKTLCALAEEDKKICAVTAAMTDGTGLRGFSEKYPERFFDVGIAEEHALTFCAGLAAGGMKPFFAVYSSFLQRGVDNIIHDIAIQGLPVRILVDRGGISPADGATHHGIFDVAILSEIPGMEIYTPSCFSSLERAITLASHSETPVAVRYSNSPDLEEVLSGFSDGPVRSDFSGTRGNVIVTYGRAVAVALEAEKEIPDCGTVLLEKLTPYRQTAQLISRLVTPETVLVFLEEGVKNGGASMILDSMLENRSRIVAIDGVFDTDANTGDVFSDFNIGKNDIIIAFRELNGN